MSPPPDIVIIGAGAAGLAAAIDLGQAGLAVSILEARNRIGGRIFTLSDPVCHAPVELGAEFIHERPPEIWNLLKKRRVELAHYTTSEGGHFHFRRGLLWNPTNSGGRRAEGGKSSVTKVR